PGGVLDFQAGLQRDAPAVPDRPLGRPDRHRGVGRDLPGQVQRGRAVLPGRHPPVHQAEPFGLVDADLAAGQHQVRGPARAPAAPSTTTRIPGAAASSAQVRASSAAIAELIAFIASGRLSVIWAIPSPGREVVTVLIAGLTAGSSRSSPACAVPPPPAGTTWPG